MKLNEALAALKPLKDYDKLVIQEKLNSGFSILMADKRGFQTAFKYLCKVKGNILYFYKLSDSTEGHIVLTLEQTAKMVPGMFDIMYDQYIGKQDLLFEDVEDNFGNVEEYTFNQSESDIINMMKENGLVGFGIQ